MNKVIYKKNIDWTEVKLKVLPDKTKKKKVKVKSLIWKHCSYVWKTRATWSRIVYFEWKILEQDWDIITVLFKDRHKDNRWKEYKVSLHKKYVIFDK